MNKKLLFIVFTLIGFVSFSQSPTRLLNTYCFGYNLPTLHSNFTAIKKSCDGYFFTVTNQTTLNEDTLTTFGRVSGRTTNLSNFSSAGIDYGTTYDVEVLTWVGTTTNLSGPAAVSCSVITPTLESQVQSSQCNTTIAALNTPIYADNITGATGFRYELVNTATSLTQTFEKTTGTLNAFSLSDFPPSFIDYSITYEVKVAVKVGAGAYSSFGSMCTITTPAPPTTQIQTSQCNSTLSTINTPIYADNVSGAVGFRYQLTKLPGGTISTLDVTSGTLNAFTMDDFAATFTDYSTTYEVRVSVDYGSGFGSFGSMCQITTPSVPATQLEYYCNTSIPLINTPLTAVQVANAEAYKFEVTDGTNTTEVFPDPVSYTCVLISVGWATYTGTPANIDWVTHDMTVSIRVSVFVDGGWTPYGVSCDVTTPCGSELTVAMHGRVINYLYYDAIDCEASSCSNIEDYQFRYRLNSVTTVYDTATIASEATEDPNDTQVKLYEFGPIGNFPSSNPYGNTYRISVRIKADGVWSPFGPDQIVTTPASPTVKIRDGSFAGAGDQCGSFGSPYPMTSMGEILAAYNLYGFSSYTFEVRNESSLVAEELTRSASQHGSMARALRIAMAGDPTPNGTNGTFQNDYNTIFRIRVKTNLGGYGDACYVRTPLSMITMDDNDIADAVNENNDPLLSNLNSVEDISYFNLYPNPYENKVDFSYSAEFDGEVNYLIYDISGKLLHNGNTHINNLKNHELWNLLEKGNYIIHVINNDFKSIRTRFQKI
ncbi:MAG: T9SS type A sorting domain-containing protein [Crocinitomicaceae bacterium]|nr:T9SS type A sorting domain-containing protein [Crocinitomicaceae bacterium]